MARSGGEYVAARAGAPDEHPGGEGANGSANGQAAPPPPPISPEPGSPARFARELLPVAASEEDQIVSRRLYERLSAEDVREIEAAIAKDDHLQAYYGGASDSRHRVFLLLSFGVWLSIPAVLEKMGLGAAQPPEDVHAMARGPLAAAGGLYEADMVAAALASVGAGIESAAPASTSAAPPGACCACWPPPTREIALARLRPQRPGDRVGRPSTCPASSFFVSGNAPPLPLADGSLDLVYAISIWSHFEPALRPALVRGDAPPDAPRRPPRAAPRTA